MEPPKLVIASVLKPVNDTRMYEKFALSLSQAKKYEINIIGFYSKNIPASDNISFHPIFNFSRLSLSRLLAPCRFLIKMFGLKPKVLIITTHELLLAASFYKLVFSRAKLYYDIRENYYLNISSLDVFPYGLRHIIAAWVRFKEWLTYPFVQQYLLAERCYENELPFVKNKFEIIENKAVRVDKKFKQKGTKIPREKRLLFSGTLAKTTGVFDAIKLVKKLHQLNPNITLRMVGYCARKEELNLIKSAVGNHDFISLVGGDKLVDHNQINQEISAADFGIIYYPGNLANDNAIPTKLYEYIGNELPIITAAEWRYQQLADPYSAAVYLDFQSPDYQQLVHDMENQKFYKNQPGGEVFWENEEAKLIDLICNN